MIQNSLNDLRENQSGLRVISDKIEGKIDGVGVVELSSADVVRHRIVSELLGLI